MTDKRNDIQACNLIPKNFSCGIEEINPELCRKYVTEADIKNI